MAGDVGRDGLGLDDEGRAAIAACDIFIHSAATVAFDSPLDSAVEVNLLGPSRIATLLHDLGVSPHLVAVSTCYVAGNRRGAAPEQLLDGRAVLPRRRLAPGGRRGPPRPRRHRRREPRTRDARPVPPRGPPRARRSRHAAARREDRAAAHEVGARPPRHDRPGAGGEPRLARRLRVHEGARRAGAGRDEGRPAGDDRAPVDHRVGARRAQARAGSAASAWPSR